MVSSPTLAGRVYATSQVTAKRLKDVLNAFTSLNQQVPISLTIAKCFCSRQRTQQTDGRATYLPIVNLGALLSNSLRNLVPFMYSVSHEFRSIYFKAEFSKLGPACEQSVVLT